ncbi:MAG: nitroreductase family protein [Muribaculaceae bacterium]|nr:nitroreductase family protein [Muribaculaceae bacterium]
MESPNLQALNNILTRTSDRNFDKNKAVEKPALLTILNAAMAAPSGVNKQPWHFVVVTSRALLDELAHALPYCKSAASAPAAIVVCGDETRFLAGDDATLWVQDVSAASENILLAAHALGLGAVWTAVYPHPDREAAVREILNLPANLVPFNIIPIGHPETTHNPIVKWDPAKITWMDGSTEKE